MTLSRKVTQDPADFKYVKQAFPVGSPVSAYGGDIQGQVKGYRRTNHNGTLVIVQYTNTWDDGYSETRTAHLSPGQLS